MKHVHHIRPRTGVLCLAASAMGLVLLGSVSADALAGAAKPAAGAASIPRAKDVVVDAVAPAAAAQPSGGRLVPTPSPQHGATTGRIYTTPMHDAATAGALGDLGLALLRQASATSGQANVNAVVSPVSVASAMGMVHAGAAGDTARELATLLSSGPAGDQGLAYRLPSVLDRLGSPATAGGPFVMANRVWIRKDVAGAIPGPFAAMVKERFDADGVSLPFDNADAVRQRINQWTSEKTYKRIPQLLPAGAVTPSTKLVVTNAIHFKSKWAEPFDAKATESKPFNAPGGALNVPTMVDERAVAHGTVDNLSVFELPFAGKTFSLMIAMAPKGHTLDALEKDLAGLDMAAWSGQLKESTCRLELPKFSIEASAQSLKAALQSLGVRKAFTDQAELAPMLGKAATGTGVDDVYHSATLVIDELGGEAAAATAVTVQAKSFQMPAPACSVDRPFIFAIVHKPSGAPLFVGKVANPLQGTKAL